MNSLLVYHTAGHYGNLAPSPGVFFSWGQLASRKLGHALAIVKMGPYASTHL